MNNALYDYLDVRPKRKTHNRYLKKKISAEIRMTDRKQIVMIE